MKKNGITSILLILLGTLTFSQAQHILDWNAGPLQKSKINTQNYRAWVPEGIEKLHGTLIVIPGRHGDGRPMANDPYWQEIAKTVRFALLACQFSDGEPFDYQGDPSGEVSAAILAAVKKLSEDSNHSELDKAPIALWGHSAGGCVSENVCSRFPKRVAAFVSAKCPRGPGGAASPEKFKIPMLILVGKNDKPDWVKNALDNTEAGMAAKAPWTLALHPSDGHGIGNSAPLTAGFFKTIIPIRLGLKSLSHSSGTESPEDSGFPQDLSQNDDSSTPSSKLQKVNLREGWLGNPATLSITSYESYNENKSKAVWLPSEEVAQAWALYLQEK